MPSFDALYDRHFDDVVRWVRALGAPESDLEDVAQNVFLVARRKLDRFHGDNLPGWLYRIAAYEVSDLRRRSWFKRFYSRSAPPAAEPADKGRPGPEQQLAQKQAARRLARLVGRLRDKHRTTFLLFELEGYSGEEIAALHGVPLATVWTRLHHARRALEKLVARARAKGESWSD